MSRIESGEILRDQIPAVWSAGQPAAGSNHPVLDAKPVTLPSRSIVELRAKAGTLLMTAQRGTSGTLTIKLPKDVGVKLSEAQIQDIAAFIDAQINP
jgi:hypothetical protein